MKRWSSLVATCGLCWLTTASTLAAAPRVVRTVPDAEAADVDPALAEILITFESAMKTDGWSLVQSGEQAFPEMVGDEPISFRDEKTCVVRVKLKPATSYVIGINSKTRQGFKAADGTPIEPYQLQFKTGSGKPPAAPDGPRVVKTDLAGNGPIRLRYDYRKGDAGRIKQLTAVDIQLKLSSGQTLPIGQKSGINCIEEVLEVEKGLPVQVRRIISEYILVMTNPQDGQTRSAPALAKPVTVKIDRHGEQARVEPQEGELPEALGAALQQDSFPMLLPAKPVAVGGSYELDSQTLAQIRKGFDPKGGGQMDLKLTLKRIAPRDVADARNEMFRDKGGGQPVTYTFDVAEIGIDWTQSGKMENDVPFTMTASGTLLFAVEAGVMLSLKVDGKIEIKPIQTRGDNGEEITITGSGTYRSEFSFEPIKWSRGLKDRPDVAQTRPDGAENPVAKAYEAQTHGEQPPVVRSDVQPRPEKDVQLPADWTRVDDKLFGTQVAVPRGWTPRVRGEAALCIEPDDVARASVFFLPMMCKGRQAPEELADGFDSMLRRALPSLATKTTGKPTAGSVQRDLSATISGVRVVGSYRAVAGTKGTSLVMGYLAPPDHIERLKPAFFRILGSYRYTGPKIRLQPFKSAAIELRIPPGWQVRTSEANGTANQDIDWEVLCPQVPGARAFMYSPKFFTPNWISDVMTGQVDPQLLALWRNKGFQMANIQADQQAVQMALVTAVPGFEVVRQQSLDEIRDFFAKLMEVPIQTIQMSGGRMTIHAVEFIGHRNVQGVEIRTVVSVGMGAMVIPAALKGQVGIWMTSIRGFEAPADRFAELAPTLDKLTGTFSYTVWWIREVMKANEQQAQTLRNLYADLNRMDREIYENRVKTNSAINEMMYDTLTENYGYLNEKTGTVEKIPADRLETFRNPNGDIVSPEDVIEKHIPVRDATPLREAGADDYMSFDRRAQVWP